MPRSAKSLRSSGDGGLTKVRSFAIRIAKIGGSAVTWLQWLDVPLKALAVLLGGLWVLLNCYRREGPTPAPPTPCLCRKSASRGRRVPDEKDELRNVGLSRVRLRRREDGSSAFRVTGCLKKSSLSWSLGGKSWRTLISIKIRNGLSPADCCIDSQVVPLPGLEWQVFIVWVHFETTAVALNSSAIVAPLAATGLTNKATAEGDVNQAAV